MTKIGEHNIQWRKVKLGEVAKTFTGLTYSPNCIDKSGTLVLRSSNIKDGQLCFDDNVFVSMDIPERAIVQENDILICVRNGSRNLIGKCALITKDAVGMAFGAFMTVLRSNIIDPKLLLYIWQSNSIQKQVANNIGATINQITNADFNRFEISYPADLSAQRRIAAILSSADKVIAATQKTIAKYKQIKQGMMEELLKPKEGWKMVRLGEVGKISMCKRVFSFETSTEGEIPFYKIGTFGKTADAFITRQLFEEYKSKFSYPKVGDILISASGTIGRTVVFDGEPAYFQDSNIIWIDNDEQIVLNQFLYYLYQTITWNLEGSTIARLYNDNFNKIEISVPYKNDKPDLIKQRRIAAILSGIDAKIAAEEKVLEKYEKVKKGLMERLLEE